MANHNYFQEKFYQESKLRYKIASPQELTGEMAANWLREQSFKQGWRQCRRPDSCVFLAGFYYEDSGVREIQVPQGLWNEAKALMKQFGLTAADIWGADAQLIPLEEAPSSRAYWCVTHQLYLGSKRIRQFSRSCDQEIPVWGTVIRATPRDEFRNGHIFRSWLVELPEDRLDPEQKGYLLSSAIAADMLQFALDRQLEPEFMSTELEELPKHLSFEQIEPRTFFVIPELIRRGCEKGYSFEQMLSICRGSIHCLTAYPGQLPIDYVEAQFPECYRVIETMHHHQEAQRAGRPPEQREPEAILWDGQLRIHNLVRYGTSLAYENRGA